MTSPTQTDFTHIEAAAAAARDRLGVAEGETAASVGVVLGSGLGPLADEVFEAGGSAIEYGAIPHFPQSSVTGHKGRLILGELGGTKVLLLQGRVHGYEGYSPQEVAFPVRVLKALGVRRVLLTNAAGGCGEGMVPGTLMLIDDHLNLTGNNPLIGHNDERLGPRFPDMSDTYTATLREMAVEVARSIDVDLKRGVYAGLNGPSYETPAEIRMLQVMGATAVGMSTVFEAIACAHGGVEVLGISCITNLAAGLGHEKLSHDEVKETASRVKGDFTKLVRSIVPKL